MRRAYIPNGYARRHGCTARDVDPAQLRLGTKVEMEHTRDPATAQQIALDHICEAQAEGSTYYVRSDVKHERLLLKRDMFGQSIGNASCSTSPRWVRGGVGFLLGGVLGSMIGGGIALAVTTTQFDISAPIDAVKRARNMALVATGVAVLGAAAGLTVGAWKPEC